MKVNRTRQIRSRAERDLCGVWAVSPVILRSRNEQQYGTLRITTIRGQFLSPSYREADIQRGGSFASFLRWNYPIGEGAAAQFHKLQ